MNTHPESCLLPGQFGRRIPPYLPTYDFPELWIDDTHRAIAECPLADGALVQLLDGAGRTIPGWLRREDALKLYELAFFAPADILELGSFHGLSTSILARAAAHSPFPKRVCSIDLDPMCTRATIITLESLGLAQTVEARTADAAEAVADFAAAGRQFALVFVDHSHSYRPVFEVCRRLPAITLPDGFCLFHDYNDGRSDDPDDLEYDVPRAVADGLDPGCFAFCGIYGCAALYRAMQPRR